MGATHTVRMIELVLVRPGSETLVDRDLMEQFTTDDPYGAVEAAREAQVYTLEERLGMYVEMGL